MGPRGALLPMCEVNIGLESYDTLPRVHACMFIWNGALGRAQQQRAVFYDLQKYVRAFLPP